MGAIDKDNPSSLSQSDLDYYKQANIIIHPGHVDNVQEWIEKSSVFVLPSYREGVPCSTQEAMACGRAVITTDVAGCRETIINNFNGLLTPTNNHQLLIGNFLLFIENKEKIIQFGDKSRILCSKNFDSKKQNEKLKEIMLYE